MTCGASVAQPRLCVRSGASLRAAPRPCSAHWGSSTRGPARPKEDRVAVNRQGACKKPVPTWCNTGTQENNSLLSQDTALTLQITALFLCVVVKDMKVC